MCKVYGLVQWSPKYMDFHLSFFTSKCLEINSDPPPTAEMALSGELPPLLNNFPVRSILKLLLFLPVTSSEEEVSFDEGITSASRRRLQLPT